MKVNDASILQKALLAVAIILLPVIITFALTYVKSRDYLKGYILDDLTVMADSYEGEVFQYLAMSRQRAMDFASDSFIRRDASMLASGAATDPRPLSKYLSTHKMTVDKTINRVCVISLKGRVLASTDSMHAGRDVSGEPYFKRAALGLDTTEYRFNSTTPEIAVLTEITSPETGQRVAWLANFIYLSGLSDLLSGRTNRDLGAMSWARGKRKSMEVYIVNRDGLMITESAFVKNAVLKQRADTLPVRDCLEGGKETTSFYPDYRGVEVAGASMCMPVMGWTLLVEVDASEMLAPLREVRYGALAGGVVVAGLVGGLLALFYRMVIVRLRLISAASASVAAGDYDVSVPVGPRDEIGRLSESFNAMARDIKDRTKLLRESEERLRAIIDNSLSVIYMKDPDGRYILVNRRLTEVLGLDEAEIIGRTDAEIYPSAAASVFMENDRAVMDSRTPTEFEELVRRDDGESYYLSTKVPLFDSSGTPFAVCGISTDITERRLMDDALKKSEEKYRSLIYNIPDVTWTATRDWKMVFVSPNCDEILGYSAGELTSGMPAWMALVHPDDAARVSKAYEEIFTKGRGFDEEYRIRCRDGRWVWVCDRASPAYEKEGTWYADGVVTDITGRKAAEERAERLNRLYSVLSKISEAIVRIRDVAMLYGEACRIAVEDGRFAMAWVGVLDTEARKVLPAVSWGPATSYLDGVSISIADVPEGRGPTGVAVREGRYVVSNDIESDELMVLWREKALGAGFRSSAAFPLFRGSEVMGVISLYASEPHFFNDEETKLLASMAADISFAVEAIETEKMARQADEELHFLQRLSIAIRDARDFHAALDAVITGLCEATGWSLGEAWLPSKDGRMLEYARTCRCENKGRYARFIEASAQMTFGPGHGLPGRIWEEKKPIWIPDITCPGQEFFRAGMAGKAGLKAQFGVPITEGGEVLAIVLFFMSEPRAEDRRLVDFVAAASAQLGPVLRSKLAEEARAEFEQRYEGLVNNLTVGVYRDLQGEGGHIVEANMAAVEILEAPVKSDLLKRRMSDFYSDGEKRKELAAKLIDHGFIKNENVELVTFNGRRLWASVTAVMKKDAAGEMYVDGIIEDITERKALEDQLRHAQKMEAVGQLAGGIAHDFNNILTALIGYGNLLVMKRGDDELVRGYADQMLKLSEQASSLTQGLLAFSRKQILNPQAVGVNSLVNRVEKVFFRLIGEDVVLNTSLCKEEITVKADAAQIEHVLMNFATNARDAMPDGGIVTIETRPVDLDEEFVSTHGYGTPGRYALISFADTGCGMDEETRKRIFEPFFTTKEVGKGTGIGLSMVYGTIKQHNGFIEVKSEPGRGTEFRIYLPVAEAGVEASAKSEESVDGGTETILLAEDQEDVRMILKSTLEEFGYNVITATDGEDAVKKYGENKDRVDAVILDMVMPRKNGKEAYEEIKKIRQDVRVMFTSGYAPEIMKTKGVVGQDVSFISKPVSLSDFLLKVREVLDR